jgi:hypothetical protein
MIKNTILPIILAACMASCAHEEAKVEESNQSLGEIKKAIVAVIGEPRKLSQNQREFTSQFYQKNESKLKARYYYTVTVLGARRPYSIEARAFIEQKGPDAEEPLEDSSLAAKVLREIQIKLNQSREGRNLIDDFRAF